MFFKVEECNTISCVWIRSENTICFELHFRFMIDITFSNLVDFRNLRLRCNERAGWCWNIFQNPKQMPEMDSLTNSALRPNFAWLLRSRIGRNHQKTLKISHSRFFFPVQSCSAKRGAAASGQRVPMLHAATSCSLPAEYLRKSAAPPEVLLLGHSLLSSYPWRPRFAVARIVAGPLHSWGWPWSEQRACPALGRWGRTPAQP